MSPLLADVLFILLTLTTIAGLVALASGFERLGSSDSRSTSAAADNSTADSSTADSSTADNSTAGSSTADTSTRADAAPATEPGADS